MKHFKEVVIGAGAIVAAAIAFYVAEPGDTGEVQEASQSGKQQPKRTQPIESPELKTNPSQGDEELASKSSIKNQKDDQAAPDSSIAEHGPLIIDVRSKAEWDSGHLEAATLIPLPEIAERIGEVAKNKSQKIYLHCRSGGRSGRAKIQLEGLGYTNVENVGGLEDARAKFESVKN